MSVLFFLLLNLSTPQTVSSIPAQDWLEECLTYHDPQDQWSSFAVELVLHEFWSDPKVPNVLHISMDRPNHYFHYKGHRKGKLVTREIDKGQIAVTLEGRSELTDQERENYRLSDEKVHWYRNFYHYMYGIPFKLKEAAATLDPQATKVSFNGKEAIALKVRYQPVDKNDSWTFFLDPNSKALLGCAFTRPEGDTRPNETIIFEGEYKIGEMVLPKKRTWYITGEEKVLGVDDIQSHRLLKK